ncbi:MAG: M56 family metallopeptidase [Planctomycetota bacterium]|jgi:beta-lactamase regulating signal transducer with metallopeptidase domain
MNGLIRLLGSDFCRNLLTALLHSLWQGVVIAGILLLFLRSKAAKEANVRYMACIIGLAAVVLFGLFTWAVLDYEPLEADETFVSSGLSEKTITVSGKVESIKQSNLIRDESLKSDSSGGAFARSNWRVWAICFWLTGVMVMLLRIIYVVVGGSRLRQQCRALEDERILALVEQLRKSLGIGRRIRVAVGEHIPVPGVVGCIWPVLLLPLSMVSGVPSDELRAILAHELAHIRRYDYLVNFCQMVIEAIFFFNPAVWWISRQTRFEREACCDKAGIFATGQRVRYAEVLADWAKRLSETNVDVAGATIGFGRAGDSGSMLERVRRIVVVGHRPRLRVSWYIATITLVLSLALLVGLWRGTTMTVAFAGKLLTHRERIDKMKEITETYDPQEREYGPEDRIQLSGTIRTADGSELPKNTEFVIHGYRPIHSTSIHKGRPKDGVFSTSIEYYNKVLFSVIAPGYAPLISKTYEPQPGDVISNVELVLDTGYEGRVRFVNKGGEPVAGTKLNGSYFMATKGGWRGLHTIDEVISGEDGIAVIENCIERPIKMNARVNGYQAEDNRDVRLMPDEVFVWELVDAEPTTGVVVSRESSEPIAGAEIRLGRKDKSDHRWSFGGSSRIVLAKTNNHGEFVLGSLSEKWEYTFIVGAEGYNRTILTGVNMGEEGLKVELGPELYLRGKVVGDMNALETMSRKPIVRWESRYNRSGSHDMYSNGWVDVEIIDGEGHFTISDIMGDCLIIGAGGKMKRVQFENQSIDDFVIDLRPQAAVPQDMREVVLEFDVPEGAPPPEGEIRINTNSHENIVNKVGWTSEMYPIDAGRVRLELPAPGRLSYGINWSQGPRMSGYWIDRKSGIEIPAGDGPFVISVPAHPAGAIYGEIFEADGRPAKDVKLHLMVLRKAPVMKRAYFSEVFGHEENELGRFNASPLPLGGEYVIVAYRDSTWASSKPIKLDEEHSIRQIEIRFVEGITVSGKVAGPDGEPFAGAIVSLSADVRFPEGPSWGTGAGKVTTGEDGRFFFDGVNPKLLQGKYTLGIDPGEGYQDVRMEIKPKRRPVNIKLQKGYGLTGVLLDDATGWPIPDAWLCAEAVKKSGMAGDYPRADDSTDEQGRFQFSDMGKKEYRLYLPGADIVNYKRSDTVTGGQKERVTLRVKLREWSNLEPLRPVSEFD